MASRKPKADDGAAPTTSIPAPSTSYVVLRKGTEEDVWRIAHGGVPARSDVEAIKAATAELDAEGRTGTFVAVPARSFRPRTRSVETVEKDRWT